MRYCLKRDGCYFGSGGKQSRGEGGVVADGVGVRVVRSYFRDEQEDEEELWDS